MLTAPGRTTLTTQCLMRPPTVVLDEAELVNLFRNKFTRERVVPTIVTSVSMRYEPGVVNTRVGDGDSRSYGGHVTCNTMSSRTKRSEPRALPSWAISGRGEIDIRIRSAGMERWRVGGVRHARCR
jgi:hypothetical protein